MVTIKRALPAIVLTLALAGCGEEAGTGAGPAVAVPPASAHQAGLSVPQLPLVPQLLPGLFPQPKTGPPPLFDPNLPINAPPVAVPLEYRMPSFGVSMPVLGVGSDPNTVFSAPEGPPDDPVWTKAFWFRGSAAPGTPGVTDIIGHVDDSLGRADPFAKVKKLSAGDVVEVVDQRTGEVIHYRITGTRVVRADKSLSTAELSNLFGAGAVTGAASDKAADAASGVSRLTLMTCTGAWQGGGFNQRFFAFGVRDDSAPA